MRGTGGPLLCIEDLLSDVGEEAEGDFKASDLHHQEISQPSSSIQPLDLTKLFQENYERINEALAGTDHSWTALTLKLCTSLETANKLVQTTNTNAKFMLEKVGELEKIVKRGDSAVAAAKAITLNPKDRLSAVQFSNNEPGVLLSESK